MGTPGRCLRCHSKRSTCARGRFFDSFLPTLPPQQTRLQKGRSSVVAVSHWKRPAGARNRSGCGPIDLPSSPRRAAPQQPLCDVSDRCGSSVGSVICGVATAPHSLSLHLGSAQHLPRAHGRHILVRHEPSSTGRSAATLVLFLLLRLDGRALRRRCRIRI